jgi:3-hydroxyacyl-[acyl-carrier-protein] dehydratase
VKSSFGKLHAEAFVDDKLVAQADFIFALKKNED